MPRDAVSRTANVERTGRHKWVKYDCINKNPHPPQSEELFLDLFEDEWKALQKDVLKDVSLEYLLQVA